MTRIASVVERLSGEDANNDAIAADSSHRRELTGSKWHELSRAATLQRDDNTTQQVRAGEQGPAYRARDHRNEIKPIGSPWSPRGAVPFRAY